VLDLFKTPKLYFYRFILIFVRPLYVRLFRIHGIGVENLPETGPYLVMANHSHLLDPFFIGAILSRPVFQMASNEFFRKPLMRRFMWAMGAFPRKKGFVDFKSIKYAIQIVRQGHPLGIYPEGGRNWDGETLPILKSTAKLVKLLNVPLVTIVSKGNYKAYPRWADRKRKSHITIYVSKPVVFDRKTPDEEIIEYVQKGIYNNDNFTDVGKIRGKNPAEGLTRLLWRCPSCRETESLEEILGRYLSCRSCGKEWEVNLDCFIREKGSETWFPIKKYSDTMFREDEIGPIQPDIEHAALANTMVYLCSKLVTFFHEPKYPKLEKAGEGRLFLTDTGLCFIGTNDESWTFRFEDIRGRSTEQNTFFQLVLNDDIARFEMKQESCYKWELYYDYIRKKRGYAEEE
jgi:1-acyl-sn-glycerol-3-phosphate acyltransferase